MKMYNKIETSGLATYMVAGSFISMTILSGLVLSSSFASADDVVDQINITVPVSCTISGTGMGTHNASISNGTYQANIGSSTIKAFCNDMEGFSIYAAGYTGEIIGETNSNKLVGTSVSGNATIATGTATSAGNPDVSNWAMKLTAVTSPTPTYPITIATGYDDYHAVPNEYTKVATRLSSTDIGQSAEGASFTTTYGAYISKTQPADTYSGKVIYTLVHPANHVAPVACKPNGTTIGTNASTDIKCMQDISSTNKSAILSSMTTGTQYTLTDKRDEKTYTVAKLADGNIWMTQNLDLDLDSSKTYTNLDTDLGWNTSTSTYDTASWTPSSSTKPSTDTTWDTTTTGNTILQSYDPGNLYWSGTLGDFTSVSSGNSHYHLGNYYDWTAAIAMNDSSSITTIGTIVEQSICPAGWTLPRTGSGDKTFQALWEQYGYDADNEEFDDVTHITGTPAYFTFSGVSNGSLQSVGFDGNFWSPVMDDVFNARYVYLSYDGYAIPSTRYYRSSGYSVRCLAR
ncbi:hypothetical protein IKF12_01090 [Candidatus Saccharibacteria bacterium]|nr:hypothetical protein [Candidatus Saccharibacteria bacterium]